MQVYALSCQNYHTNNFKGQLKLNPRNMDIIDWNLFNDHSGDIAEFVQKQKYDYIIQKTFNRIHVLLEEQGKFIDERLVANYTDGKGNKHIEKVFDVIKRFTAEKTSKQNTAPRFW